MKKRILSALLAFAMIFTLMPTALAATTYQVVTVDKTTVQAGETVNVKVTLPKGIRTAGSFTVDLKFDKDKFEVQKFKSVTMLSATDGDGEDAVVAPVKGTVTTANEQGALKVNAAYPYNTIQVAGVTVIDATLKAKAPGDAAFSFSIFEITYSDNGTQYIVKKDQLEAPPTVTITKDEPVASKIVLTPPASTTVAVPKSDTPNEIDLPTAAVYDQYGKPMTGTFSITYAIDGITPTGVTLDTGAEKMKVKRTAQAGEVEVVAKLTTTAGTVTSDPVTYTITRETSKVTHVLVSKLFHNMPVPKVTEPGGTSSKDEQFTAEVLDQYLQEMTGQTVTWRVTDTAGNPVTGVSIDNTGKLTVTNEAPGIKVYAIATCQGVDSNNLDMTLHRETAKDTFVVICDQVGDAPETSLLIPTGTVTEKVDYTAKVYDQYGKPTSGMVFWELDKTYTGVELDTTSIPGSATLKVDKTAESGTIKLTAKCSTVGSTASKTLDITLTKKTVDTTSLEVTQADTTYGTPLADPVFTKPEGTIKTLVHYSTPDSSAYSSDTPPTNAGEYVVNVVCETATHIYMGHANFKIEPKSISNMLQPITGTYTYTGAPQKPEAVVKDGEVTLVEGTDYTVSYGTNVHVFEAATVSVEGKGNYTGTFSRNFKIQPKPIDIGDVNTTDRDYEEGRLDVDCTVKLPVASDVKQGEHYLVFATMADDTAGSDKTVNVQVKMVKGGLGENYTLKNDTTTATVNIHKINPADPTDLKGVKGQKLSAVELPDGWTWYAPSMVMDTAGKQTFLVNYIGDANHNALHMHPITVTVLDKTNVSAFITFPDGEKEYTGSWMKYEAATIEGSGLDTTTAKWNYTYAAGTGTLMEAGFPQGVGTYTVTATYEDSLNFGTATATLTIVPRKVAIPAADTTVFTYDGTAQTYGIADTADYTVSGNTQTNANESGYTVTVALKDKTTTAWTDGTTADKTYTFKIMKAASTGEPAYTKITTSGKTLKDAGLTVTGSTLKPNAGTLEWVDGKDNVLPDTTTVAANTTYKWRFTPDDANYKVLTGFIELYHESSSGGGGGVTTYSITVKSAKNGDVTASHKSASKGTTVTLTVDPDKGYVLDTLTVLDGKDKEIKLTEKNGKYTFTMPASKVTVEAMFKAAGNNPFTDVPAGSYYEDAVIWAVDKGITTGTSATTFNPNGICTRAQAVTFLWRAAGSPAAKSAVMPFTDVKAGSYCYDAVLWAVEQGITKGTSETMFSPDATCTRAQIVTFLWRANGSPAVSGNSAFTDVAADAYYAAAVTWAEKNDITGGIGGGLFGSNNNCTRAQIVTFIYRSVK